LQFAEIEINAEKNFVLSEFADFEQGQHVEGEPFEAQKLIVAFLSMGKLVQETHMQYSASILDIPDSYLPRQELRFLEEVIEKQISCM
jgi:hypothetical protein